MPTPLRCDPKLFEKDLTDQVIIVTGANSGIGFETTKQLLKQNATVVMACRSKERGEAAANELNGEKKEEDKRAVFLPLDLSSLDSVRAFAKEFEEKYDRLDALVNNAGVMACPQGTTKDGFEMQIGCNHLAHYLLMRLLTPMLLKTAEETGKPSRFIAVSSVAAAMPSGGSKMAYIDFDDLNWETRKYSAVESYQQSKLANSLHAKGAASKYSADKLISVSLHPGWVQSKLDQHMVGQGFFKSIFDKVALWSSHMITAEDGAQTSLHCLLEDADKMESGAFYSQFGIYVDKDSKNGGWPMNLPNPNFTDENAEKLWDVSAKLVGL